jgi:hypothetical protein
MTMPLWTALDADLSQFLDAFDERRANDGADIAPLFAPTFLALDPANAVALTPEVLAQALPTRRRMFAEAGVGETRRVHAEQLRLDDNHILLSVEWSAEREAREALELSSMFLVRRDSEGTRVLVYLNRNDIVELLASP